MKRPYRTLLVTVLFVATSLGLVIEAGRQPAAYAASSAEVRKLVNQARAGDRQAFAALVKYAEAGDSIAQFTVGLLYRVGKIVPRNDIAAARWFQQAANQGNADAQNRLGVMYEKGEGIAQDYAAAATWYSKAAKQGDPIAQNNLGVLYERGAGITRNVQTALHWYRQAAAQGYKPAQQNVARLEQGSVPPPSVRPRPVANPYPCYRNYLSTCTDDPIGCELAAKGACGCNTTPGVNPVTCQPY